MEWILVLILVVVIAATLILASAGMVALVVLILNSPSRALRQHAQRDYETARGTQHRKDLQRSLSVLRARRNGIQRECANLQRQLSSSQVRCRTELDRLAVSHIVRSQLETIPGIGPNLASAILARCYDGTLASLRRAYTISGIGPQRQGAINAWVRSVEYDMPRLLENDFPGKSEVTVRYDSEHSGIARRLEELTGEVTRLEEMESTASGWVARLSVVHPKDFSTALKRGTVGQNPAIIEHLTGAFPEWEPVPPWYAELLKEAGR